MPGAIFTAARAINPSGDIVGDFQSSDGMSHGFLLSQGVFTQIDIPGSILTRATGINASGEIVGFFRTPDFRVHGFLLGR